MYLIRLAVVCGFLLLAACQIKNDTEDHPGRTDTESASASKADSAAEIVDSDTTTDSGTGEKNQCLEGEDTETDTDADETETTIIDEHIDSTTTTVIDSASDSELCPDDMVPVERVMDADAGVSTWFCMDRFEAARSDADATSAGQDDTVAVSKAGVMPWLVNPMNDAAFVRFKDACEAAAKRLCTSEEWTASCVGPKNTLYVFGDTFDRETCNCVDTFCDDYCHEQGIPDDECYMSANCGYRCGSLESNEECFEIMPTGSFADCTNEFGTFDINGNLWEIVESTADTRGYEVRGGAINCASASSRLKCSFNADWNGLYAGFRCCKDGVAK